jgi:bla regulator protein BlaR1
MSAQSMAQWCMYAVAVGAALTLAALAAEQGARLARRAGRWCWLLAMALSVCLPLLALGGALPSPLSPPAPTSAAHGGPGATITVPTLVAGGLPATPALTLPVWSSRGWLPAAAASARGADLDRLARLAWPLCTLLLAAALAGAHLALQRRRRRWQSATVAGAAVLVSVDAGPAVVGVLRPRIVLPGWLLSAPPSRLSLVVAHEQAHIDAGDQRLLVAAWLLLLAMPFNVPLWFQLRRLRRAIEVDCDARVLAQGFRLADYGDALIEVGGHAPRLSPLAPAMAAPSSFLARRIRLMTRPQARWHRFAAPLLLLLSVDIGVAAARIVPPATAASAPLARQVPAAARQALAGYYQVGANRVAVVAVSADGLVVKTNMEPAWRMLAESDDRYYLPAADLRIAFDRTAGTMTQRWFGVAGDPAPRVDALAVERADAWVARRIASQAPLPDGAAIVRRNVGALAVSDLHAADFTPGFFRQASAQMPLQRKRNERLGAVGEVSFAGVNRWGWDRYQVRYANGMLTWAIWLDADGRLANATVDDPRR